MTHKLIRTKDYLLIVDKKPITNWYYNETDNKVDSVESTPTVLGGTIVHNIIAHLPLNNSPILDGVDLLPPIEDDEVNKLAMEEVGINGQIYNISDNESFIKGYNKAKERFKYTEQDLIKAMEFGMNLGENGTFYNDRNINELLDIIQSLQQPKMPIKFKCEVNETQKPYDESGWMEIIETPKTITNSQGIQWVGKYIFE